MGVRAGDGMLRSPGPSSACGAARRRLAGYRGVGGGLSLGAAGRAASSVSGAGQARPARGSRSDPSGGSPDLGRLTWLAPVARWLRRPRLSRRHAVPASAERSYAASGRGRR